MKHLSEREVCDYVDGLMGAHHAAAAEHIAACGSCRSLVALHRRIRSEAAHGSEGLLSEDFTKRIMRDIHMPQAAPRFSWLVENSAHIVAMIFVAGIVGGIFYVAGQASPEADSSVYSRQLSLWHDSYSSVMNAIAARNRELLLPVVSETTGFFNSVFVMAVAALLVLGSLDKLRVFSKFVKTR